jgi:hypothetical protein
MLKLTNYHVRDSNNIGDLLSSPLRYFQFPGFDCQTLDIGKIDYTNVVDSHIIIGGGGLLCDRFLPHVQAIYQAKTGRVIFWGVGQQRYGSGIQKPETFDYGTFLSAANLLGIRDDGMKYPWVPCVSCMHPAFDKPRSPQHEIVVFSHNKFQIHFPGLPHLTNTTDDFESVLDFLGSGETILTSSFHGAYWGILLGRKVLTFPFSSKFTTLRHKPATYPLKHWTRIKWKIALFKQVLYQQEHEGDKLTCDTNNWSDYLRNIPTYPDSLEECRDRNRWFYKQVMEQIIS